MTIANSNRAKFQDAAPQPDTSPSLLDRLFKIGERGSSVKQEIRGGVATFFTMACIVVLNPLILGGFSSDAAPVDVAGTYLPAAAVGAATGLAAGLMTITFGKVANLPFGLAAGLGINSFPAVSVIGDLTWSEAMGLVLLNGIVLVIFGLTGAHTAIFRAIPKDLKAAITVGIGLSITFIGFVDSGFATRTPAGPPVQLGNDGSISSPTTVILIIGVLAMGGLVARKVQGGLLIGTIATTILAVVAERVPRLGAASEANPGGCHLNVPERSGTVLSLPDFWLLGQFDTHIGAMGSRTSREARMHSLRATHLPEQALARLHCPIGLGLEAITPGEVAIGSAAEFLAARSRHATGVPLKSRAGPIHAHTPHRAPAKEVQSWT